VLTDEFWAIVEAARAGAEDTASEADVVADELVDRLSGMTPARIVEFELVLDEVTNEAYRLNLWAAAYLINGGCSDDCFDYFRGWLVAQGRAVWDAALADPDSLADVVTAEAADDSIDGEGVLVAASRAYGRVAGSEEQFWDALERARATDPAADSQPEDPSGEDFDFDFDDHEQMKAHLPRLAAIFVGEGPRTAQR
jgi:hypothetical protein